MVIIISPPMTLRFLVLLVLLQVTSGEHFVVYYVIENICILDAFIEFEHSRLYDEKDFEGIATVSFFFRIHFFI